MIFLLGYVWNYVSCIINRMVELIIKFVKRGMVSALFAYSRQEPGNSAVGMYFLYTR